MIKGGKENAIKFMNALQLASNEVYVADIRTCILHPASETHRQLTKESVEDIIKDLDRAFSCLEV